MALGTEVKRYLYICNQTAITTNFGVSMGTFAASDAAACACTSSLAKDDVVRYLMFFLDIDHDSSYTYQQLMFQFMLCCTWQHVVKVYPVEIM